MSNRDAAEKEWCGVRTEIRGDGVKHLWKVGGSTREIIGPFQITGTKYGSIQRWLAIDSPKHQEGAEGLGTAGGGLEKGGGRHPGFGCVLSVSGTGGDVV